MNTETPVNPGAAGSSDATPGKAGGGNAAPVVPAVAASPASGPGAAITPAKPFEFSPGVAELSPADRRAAFLAAAKGEPVKPKEEPKEKKGESETEEEEEEETSEEPKEKPGAKPADKGNQGESDDDLVSGLQKHAEKHPELKGLLTRTQKVMKQNSERGKEIDTLKSENETLKARPVNVLQPGPNVPLGHLTTHAEVDAEVSAMITEANGFIEWLVKHEAEGGIWDKGGKNEQPMTKEEVASALTYFKGLRDGGAKKQGEDRKAYLDQYAETVKGLKGVTAAELEDPKTPEGAFLKSVPELRRDPTFMRILADAKAGRVLREEEASGVTRVVVKPGKAKLDAPKPKAGDEPLPREEPTEPDLGALRTKSEAGDPNARKALRSAFVKKFD